MTRRIDRAIAGVVPQRAPTRSSVRPSPAKRIKSKDWIALQAKRWKKAGRINDRTTQETFSKMITDEMSTAKAAGVPVRTLTQGYIRSHLADFGIWPISAIK